MFRHNDHLATRSTLDPRRPLEPGATDSTQTAPTAPADPASSIDRTPAELDGPTAPAPALPSASRAPVTPPRRVEQFVLRDRIGAGGMGDVFAAFDDKLQRNVAIKLVATQASEARARQRLLREAQALAQLSHPNVVTVYEVGTLPDGGLFIAMELVKGETLRTWQRRRRGAWRDLVSVYADAGRGLAAAHRSGIIHRDFKPDNVLVGDDGRVRVADFGLACAADRQPAPAADEAPLPAAAARGSAPDDDERARSRAPEAPAAVSETAHLPASVGAAAPPLTAAGGLVGTPGYMAPEQLAGTTIDARADQFSFCVALYEALHGERPRPDNAIVPRRDPARAYPRWLAELLQRGLASDPALRFATMDALVAELTRSRERTRRRAAAGATLAAAVTAGAMIVALRGASEPPPCPLATGELVGVWDPAIRQRGQAAITGTAAPFASSMWSSTAAAFDRYAERWLAAHQAACEDTQVRHVQSAELLDRRMECLASRRRSLGAAADVLQQQPGQAVLHGSELIASLGDIAQCSDTGVLLAQSGPHAGPPISSNPAIRTRTAIVRQQLASATALLAAGDARVAGPIIAAADQLAKDMDDDALHAEVTFSTAKLLLARGEVPRALAEMNRAAELAVASHHDELSADIWLELAISAGSRDQRPAEIKQWLAQGEAWIRRLGHTNDARRVALDHARGFLQYLAADSQAAVATLSHAIETAERLWGPSDPRLIAMLRDRAGAEARLRQAKPAVSDAERALSLSIAAWGPSHPEVARTRRALGLYYIEQLGDLPRGEREVQLALELYRSQLGPDSIEVANCEQMLGQAGQFRGEYAAALEHIERADRIFTARLGPEHPRRGETLMALGVLRFMRKDYPRSLEAYQAAYPILRASLGDEHHMVALLLSDIGETLLALGHSERARDHFTRALRVFELRLGPEHADLAFPLKGIGLAHLQAGRPSRARASLERALALRSRSAAASDPQEVAEIQWGLARTLRAGGQDARRARELARSARQGYRGLGSDWDRRVREIDQWLATADELPGQGRR